jgi:hypothetical protein
MARPLTTLSHHSLLIRVRALGLAIRLRNGEYTLNYTQGTGGVPLRYRDAYRKHYPLKNTEKGNNTLRLKIWKDAQKMAERHPEWLKPRGSIQLANAA